MPLKIIKSEAIRNHNSGLITLHYQAVIIYYVILHQDPSAYILRDIAGWLH